MLRKYGIWIAILGVLTTGVVLSVWPRKRQANDDGIAIRVDQPNDTGGETEGEEALGLPNLFTVPRMYSTGHPGLVVFALFLERDHRQNRTGRSQHGSYRRDYSEEYEGSSYYNGYDPYDGASQRYHNYHPGFDVIMGGLKRNLMLLFPTDTAARAVFSRQVLIKNVYIPSQLPDTVNGVPVRRNFILCSVFDTDTNADTLLDHRDLRRLYAVPVAGGPPVNLLPPDYSVQSSAYSPANDVLFYFARQDRNQNGEPDVEDPIAVFRLDPRTPLRVDQVVPAY